MVVSRRSSTRVAGAEATSASNPLADLEDLYPSADEGDGDRGDRTSVPSGPEGFDMSFPSPPGSPMEADPTTVEFNLGAGSFTPKSSRRSRSSARSGHARGSRRAASPMPTTPPAAAGLESPESPSVADFFNPKQWPPRSGSRPRDGGSEGGAPRSATAPEFATYVDKSGATPESFPASKSFGAATPLGEHTAVHGEFSPDLHFRGFGARDAGPFSPFAAAKREEAAPPVDAFADLSFNLRSGGEKSRANKSEKSASARRRGVSPRKASQTREAFSSRVETSAFAKNGTSSFSSETDAAETTNAAPFQFTPPPPAASHPTFPTFPTFSDAGLRGAPFAPAAPFGASLFAPGSGNPKPAFGKKTVSGKKTPKKKPSASAPGATFASSATTPPRSPTEVAKDRIPPSIFAAAEVRSSDPASPASGGRRSPLRRASRPQKSASPTPSPPSSPMDILRERVASVNLGRGDAPDSAAAAHRAAAAGAANVSFTFSSASSGASPFASEATKLKEAGNAAFKAGRYQVATANYDEALERMAREFPTLRIPEALRDDCVAHEADASLAKKGKEASFVAGGRDAAVCYANRAAARLMNVNDAARGGAFEKIVAGDDARVSNGSRRAVAAASDVRAALRDCRAALAADPSFRRARLRAGTCLMRLGAFEAARAEFLLAADSGSGSLDAGGTAAEARRLAGDAARAAALVDDLTRVDGGALASLRRHSVDGASVGARRVKTNAFLAAEGNGGNTDGDDEKDDKDASSSSRSVAATARGVLRSVRDISAVAPHCAAVAEAKARALLWEGRFADAATAADAEGLGGAAHRKKKSGGAKSGDASLADASPRAFCFETGGEAWRARVRFLARFATGDLAGAVEASGVESSESSGDGFGDDGDILTRDGKAGRGGAEENADDAKKKNTEASVMNDDASLVASRVADEIESAEKACFVSLLSAATEAHALRVQGNASFKAKKYERAAETYTSALEALSTAPGGALSAAFCSVCLCNRAAAAHAEGRVADALADCGRALALNPARIKSLSRRAQLYAETRMHDAAADDLQRLLATLALGTETKRDASRGGSLSAAARLADAAAGAEDPSSKSFAEFRDGVTARLREARSAARAKTTPDHVAVLGLGAVQTRGVSSVALALLDSDVKKAYRRLALKHHPDKSCVGLPGWADAEALRRDADAVFKLVGEAHAALASAEKRREFDAADRKARFANEYASSFGASAPSDFGFSTFARDAARHGSSRRGGGSAGGGSASRGGYRRAGGAHGEGGGGSFYGDWFGEENRAGGRGAYRSRRSGGGGYKT